MTTYNQEETLWYESFLQIYYFNLWKNNYKTGEDIGNLPGLELFVYRKCNLACAYCYLNNHGEELCPDEIDKIDPSLVNAKKLLDFLATNNMAPQSLEVFGGEALSLRAYSQLFDMLFEYTSGLPQVVRRDQKPYSISFPLNLVILAQKGFYELFLEQQRRFIGIDVILAYSISTDGKFADPISRPSKDLKFAYDDAFYSLIESFYKEAIIKPGFHPMIAAENIHVWKENLDWYIDFMQRCTEQEPTEIPPLYLLEVRNDNWTTTNLRDLDLFLNQLADTIYKRFCGSDPEKLFEFFITSNFFNLGSALIGYTPRGIGCSLQTNLTVRTADLSIVPCHRLAYQRLIPGQFEVANNKVTGKIVLGSPYMHLASVADNTKIHPDCIDCEISAICPGPCLGANFEATGEAFITSPAVCRLEKAKVTSLISILKRYNILDRLYSLQAFSGGASEYNKAMQEKHRQIKLIDILANDKELI